MTLIASALRRLFAIHRFPIVLQGLHLDIEDFGMVANAVWVTIVCGLLLVSFGAIAANNSNTDALKKTTADCQAQVKEYAKYNATSWYGRRKMIKQCVQGLPWRKD